MNGPVQGYTIQTYRGATGYSDKALRALLPEWKEYGVKCVVAHGFTNELTVAKYEAWATPVIAAGLLAGAAFGLGATNRDHPDDTGHAMGAVFASALCSLGMVDAEGVYDNNARQKVALMMTAMRKVCPKGRNWVVDQLWFAILHHPNFPVEEFSAAVDEHDAQVYVNDFISTYHRTRYPFVMNWYQNEWTKCETERLEPKGLVIPRGITIQGYGWDDIPADCVRCLGSFRSARIWCEPFPSETVMMCMRAVEWFITHGYDTSKIGVARFQKEAKLAIDGDCGFDTMRAMGITKRNVVQKAMRAMRMAFAV